MINVVIATPTNILNIRSSYFKCINILTTNIDLIEAMVSAVIIIQRPMFMPANDTVAQVNASNPSQLSMYLP